MKSFGTRRRSLPAILILAAALGMLPVSPAAAATVTATLKCAPGWSATMNAVVLTKDGQDISDPVDLSCPPTQSKAITTTKSGANDWHARMVWVFKDDGSAGGAGPCGDPSFPPYRRNAWRITPNPVTGDVNCTRTSSGSVAAEPEVEFVLEEIAPDGDGDGLNDAEEADRGTDPADPDTDGDLFKDGTEVNGGTCAGVVVSGPSNPNDARSIPGPAGPVNPPGAPVTNPATDPMAPIC